MDTGSKAAQPYDGEEGFAMLDPHRGTGTGCSGAERRKCERFPTSRT